MQYDLDSLEKTFSKHVDIWKKQHEEWKEKHPDRIKYEDEDFCISHALLEMVKEINRLRNEN